MEQNKQKPQQSITTVESKTTNDDNDGWTNAPFQPLATIPSSSSIDPLENYNIETIQINEPHHTNSVKGKKTNKSITSSKSVTILNLSSNNDDDVAINKSITQKSSSTLVCRKKPKLIRKKSSDYISNDLHQINIPIIHRIYVEITKYFETANIVYSMLRWESTMSSDNIVWFSPDHPYVSIFNETWPNMRWRIRDVIDKNTKQLSLYGCHVNKHDKLIEAVWKQLKDHGY